MPKVHLHDVSLTASPTTDTAIFADAQLAVAILASDELVTHVLPEPRTERNSMRSWIFKVNRDIPASLVQFTIYIIDLRPDEIHAMHLESVDILRREVVNLAQDRENYDFATEVASTSNGKSSSSFDLRVGFSFKYSEFPLSAQNIADALRKEFDPYDMKLICESIRNIQHTDPRRSELLYLAGGVQMKQYKEFQDPNDLDHAIELYDDAVKSCLLHDDQMPEYLGEHGASLLVRFRRAGDTKDISESILKIQDAIRLTPDDHPKKPLRLNNLGVSLFMRFERLGKFDDLNESILKVQDAIQLTSDDHPTKPSWLSNLGGFLIRRFERAGDLGDLNESILRSQEAVRLTPDGYRSKPTSLNNLGTSLFTRFELLGDLSDLSESILKIQDAVRLASDGFADKSLFLNNLGNSLYAQFKRVGDIRYLQESIVMSQDAVRLTPDGHLNKPSMLTNLGKSLLTRFEQLGDLDDINEAVLQFQYAVRLTPNGHPDKPSILSSLGSSLLTRFERLGDINDINESVRSKREAEQLTPDGHSHKPLRLNNLGNSLLLRFRRLGELSDVNEAILKIQDAVRLTPDNHTDIPSRLNNLGNSLFIRFKRLGELNDINESVLRFQDAIRSITPDGHAGKPPILYNLASSLLARFKRIGGLKDLNEAILNSREANRLTPDSHSHKPNYLDNLGAMLLRRFQRLGDLGDINESVLTKRDAERLTPDDHAYKPISLNSLGASLLIRFERLGELSDLNEAILKIQDAVRLTPNDHPDMPSRLSDLGKSLLTRFGRLESLSDINESILKFRDSVRLAPGAYPEKPSFLNSLGYSLRTRFGRTGDLADINESVLKSQEAVQLTPDGHFDKPLWLNNLGYSLLTRFQRVEDLSDLNLSVLKFREAAHADYGAPVIRFTAAYGWARCLHLLRSPAASIIEPFNIAISMLPEMALLGSSIADRHHAIQAAGRVVCEAAAAAVEAGNQTLATEWLEQGRSVIWGQQLRLRAPLEELRKSYPEHAQSLQLNSLNLENVSYSSDIRIAEFPGENNTRPASEGLEDIAQRGHKLAQEREELLTEIRQLKGFERFLLPKLASELTTAASAGPIVLLSLSEIYGTSYAIILLPSKCLTIQKLASFTASKAERLYRDLQGVLGVGGRVVSQVEAGKTSIITSSRNGSEDIAEEVLKDLLARRCPSTAIGADKNRDGGLYQRTGSGGCTMEAILADLWGCIVKPVLEAAGIQDHTLKVKPRLWWCPTGIFSFLPIHAAGIYGIDTPAGSKLSDFVASSYTPTVTTLLEMGRSTSEPRNRPHLLAVAQPVSDGLNVISGTEDEVKRITSVLGNAVSVKCLVGEEATLATVIEEFKKSDWAHFACHGIQDRQDPLKSSLHVDKSHKLTLEHLASIKRDRDGGLAFLSACQTAKGHLDLPDEAVHLGAGMLIAGYTGVIATMWSVGDHDAPQVAVDVYEHLRNSGLDTFEAARALDLAVKKFKERPGASALSWVPFIHIGR